MRLLEYNADGEFSLANDLGDEIPPYAILSHTWGADADEVTFRDLIDGSSQSKVGYNKIRFCGEQARSDGLQYFWVDTCCIDKSNSTELAEAINSMFRWYQNANKCYVYLSDVSTNDHDHVDSSPQSWLSAFQKSRWFSRGWTLQELLAPPSVEFFCSNGKLLGDKKSLEQHLHIITGIEISALRGTPLSQFTFDERMSWAQSRETKREEDKAYSLLGIFDVNMPFIYGERGESAFERLRREIQKRLKKHQLAEISAVNFNSTKRLKTSRYQSTSIPSHGDSNFLGLETLTSSEYSIDSIDVTTKQSLIDKLYFTKIDERLTSLSAAQGTTCRWFLTKSEYKSWHDMAQHPDHGGFLWIKGNPGTGKSTLMKFVFEEVKLNAKSNPLQITLSFFFLARGTAEEKSTTGLYCSLLHQLLEKVPELRDSLEWMTPDGARGIQRSGWHEQALMQTLAHAVQKLGSRSLTIFIDALDECDKYQAAGMVDFFEDLCDRAKEAQVQLHICFSSRHYPTIVIQKGLEITLEEEIGHVEDIKQYIKSKLRLGKSKLKQAELLRSEILDKSSMIFLWVVLVVEILNTKYPDNSFSTLRERLKEIPPGLAELFEMILERDGENLERLQVCLKWILFATGPLKPQELYFAIQLSLDKNCSGYWNQEDVDLDQMKSFVRSSSKGLAEVTRNKASEVQFIHESVRDFLLGKYESQWSGVSDNFVGHGHEILRNCCLAQLNALLSQDINIPNPLPKASKVEGKQLREKIKSNFPFLEYSVLNVLCHANSAQEKAILQRGFLANFPLQRWIFLYNTLEKYDIRRYTESVSILYILGERNLADLIRIQPPRGSCFDVESKRHERYGPPIFAALATGSNEAVLAFLEIEAETHTLTSSFHDLSKQYCQDKNIGIKLGRDFTFSQQRGVVSYIAEHGNEILLAFVLKSEKCMLESKDSFGWTPLSWAAEKGHEGVAKLLLERGAEVDSKVSAGQTPLSLAVERGHEAVAKLLLERSAEVDSRDSSGRTPLLWAAEKGHEAMVRLLLDGGAEVDSKDKSGRTPLLWAVERGHEAVVKLLLDGGAEVDSKDNSGQTPLLWAVERGHEAAAKLLLEGGAEVDSKDKSGQTPLWWAVERGHDAVAKLLLERSAEVDSRDSSGRTPLLWAAEKGHEAMVKLLLEGGAEVDSKDKSGQTPLSWAVRYRHEAMVKLLLDGGAEVDSKDKSSQTPLWWAVERGHEAMVRLLLDGGAEVDSKDKSGQTPLWWAVERGHEAVAKLLLERSAEVDSRDSSGRTLLLWAAEKGHEAMVKLLLDGGAEVDSKDKSGQTPLLWAVERGHEAMVRLLLDGGAEVDSKDKSGQTPLWWAVERGHEAVVKLLLEGGAEVNSKDKFGQTPLWWAAIYRHEAVVKLLLEGGAEVDSEDKSSQTLLSWAVRYGHEAVAKLLLEGGAEVDSKDMSGRTPLSWAAERGHEAVAKLLLEGGTEVDSKDNSGRTPLSWATMYKHKTLVKLLLEGGAKVDFMDSYGRTALF